MQAIVANDSLFLRFVWADPTFDAYPSAWEVDSLTGAGLPLFDHATTQSQDQLLVLFQGLPNSEWDLWHWQVHSTAVAGVVGGTITGFAEGKVLAGTQIIGDHGNLSLVRENGPAGGGAFNQPTFLHEDSMEFHGFILPTTEADSILEGEFPQNGWELHDTVPGFLTDQTIADSSATALGSRWDVRGGWRHSEGQYTVVLRGALNSGHADDLVMSAGDRIPMRLILTDKHAQSFSIGSNNQGITGLFYLQLPS
jgi:hypothetical protein